MQYAEDQSEHFILHDGIKIRFWRKDQDREVGAGIDPQATFCIWKVCKAAGVMNRKHEEEFVDVEPTPENSPAPAASPIPPAPALRFRKKQTKAGSTFRDRIDGEDAARAPAV